jgi:hypothetical protein
MLKQDRTVSDLNKIMAFYRDFEKLALLIKRNPETPGAIYMPSIKIPKYLQWMKHYLVRKQK